MNKLQKLFKFIFPHNLFNKIESESRKWHIKCVDCGYSKSYWEAGGLRAFAIGKKKIFGYCSNCKKYKLLDVTKIETGNNEMRPALKINENKRQ